MPGNESLLDTTRQVYMKQEKWTKTYTFIHKSGHQARQEQRVLRVCKSRDNKTVSSVSFFTRLMDRYAKWSDVLAATTWYFPLFITSR